MQHYTIDEVYGCNFDEFCRRTHITPEQHIRAIRAEIAMLKQAKEKYRRQFMLVKHGTERWDYLSGLIQEISARADRKQSKLHKYMRAAARLSGKKVYNEEEVKNDGKSA